MPAIRRHIHIAAPPRAVWKALTTVEGLKSWLADDARLEPRKGGRVVLTTEDDEGNPVEERGMIHTWRPTSHLEIAWDNIGQFPNKGTRISFQLALDGEETRLSLIHSGPDEIFEDEEKRKKVDDDWRRALVALQGQLDAEGSR